MAASKYCTRGTYSGHVYHELSAQNKPITFNIPNRRKQLILTLPDELLCMIVALATSKEVPKICRKTYCEPEHDRETVKALSLTCRQFSRIVLPLLYRSIRFEFPPSTKSVKSLRHAVSKRPSLLHSCRTLSIHIIGSVFEERGVSAKDYSVVNKLVSSVRNVRCLELRGIFYLKSKVIWGFIRNLAQNMHEVEHLVIHRAVWDQPLKRIIDILDLPQLRCLDFYSISPAYDDNGYHRDTVLDPKKRRTASCTSLSLPYFDATPQVLKQLIQWPKALSDFRLPAVGYGIGIFTGIFTDIPLIHSMLLIHKETLKRITIGFSSSLGGGDLFEASAFPNLEVLVLSGNLNTTKLGTPAADADSLLAPKLKTLEWNFQEGGSHSEIWWDFGDREQHWISGLAKEAIERKSTLREIKIKFDPDPRVSKLEDGYPWDRMDMIRDEIQPHGIELVYSKPAVTKERWLERGSLWGRLGVDSNGRKKLRLDRGGNLLYEGVDIRERAPPEGVLEEFGIRE